MVSQVLATHSEIDDKSEGKAIIKGAHDDVDLGIIPVFNENNAASEVELEEYDRGESAKQEGQLDAGADNDWLGAHVAISMASSALLLLTNKNGFEIDGKVEEEIRTCDIPEMVKHCNGTSGSGTGGMGSKLRAAGRAADAGIHVVIGNAFTDSRLVLKGEGTRVVQ
jgi:glutamate 5-kinase